MKKFNPFLTNAFLKEHKFRRSTFTLDGESSRLFYKVIRPFFILIEKDGLILIYRIPPRTKIRAFPFENSSKPLSISLTDPGHFDSVLEWCK